jgi:hypothetical protein
MPASRHTKSAPKAIRKEYCKEIRFTEQTTRNGSTILVPVDVPSSSTTPSSTIPSMSRQSTQVPESYMMDVDTEGSPNNGPSKKPKTPKKVFCWLPSIFSIIIDTI